MGKKALAKKRATLGAAIDWIAHNDECNEDISALDLAHMISVCFAADLFGANQYRFASAVIRRRDELGLPWRKMTPDENREFNESARRAS